MSLSSNSLLRWYSQIAKNKIIILYVGDITNQVHSFVKSAIPLLVSSHSINRIQILCISLACTVEAHLVLSLDSYAVIRAIGLLSVSLLSSRPKCLPLLRNA